MKTCGADFQSAVSRVCNPQHGALRGSADRSQLVNRDDVDRTDRHSELVFADDHHHLGREGDEIAVRHRKAAAVGQAKGKRCEAVFEPFFNLLNHRTNPIFPEEHKQAARSASPLIAALLTAFCLVSARAAEAPPGGSDLVECANLIYAGTKSSVCFSEEFLSAVGAETSICTARKFKPVKLAEKEVFKFPFAVMTGEGAFSLTDDERRNLKAYLEKGGFLLASAGCSSREWSDSFKREMDAVFPERKLAEVSMDHPIFRTVYDVKRLDTKGVDAKLFGISVGSKLVVIFTPDGLNDTATMHGCCCCGGNEIKNAQKVNANILGYALLQ